ncbi:MAG: hypothetical protein JWO03_2917 [Bacteroidetes bacterium]|nr:hypothetical protein [Bacteroidota bacterium]
MRTLLLTLFLSGYFMSAFPTGLYSAAAAGAYMQESRVTIYPNPAQDIIYIKGGGAFRIELMNMIGEVVLSEQITAGTVSISDVRPGVYIVRIYDTDGTLISSSKLTRQ